MGLDNHYHNCQLTAMPLCMTSLKSSLHVHVATNVKSEQTDTELKAVEA